MLLGFLCFQAVVVYSLSLIESVSRISVSCMRLDP